MLPGRLSPEAKGVREAAIASGRRYSEAIARSGGVALTVPPLESTLSHIDSFVERADAVLLCGVALALKLQKPGIRVIGVQIDSRAPYLYGEMPAGPVPTLADGIALKKPGVITRPLVDKWVDEIVVVDESSVADAMMLLMEHSRLFVEGAELSASRRS